MPVERFAVAVGHDVGPSQCIAHAKQRFFLHGGDQEQDETGPLVNPGGDAVGDLLVADGMVDGLGGAQGRVVGRRPRISLRR